MLLCTHQNRVIFVCLAGGFTANVLGMAACYSQCYRTDMMNVPSKLQVFPNAVIHSPRTFVDISWAAKIHHITKLDC